jgi:hypothetical protein
MANRNSCVFSGRSESRQKETSAVRPNPAKKLLPSFIRGSLVHPLLDAAEETLDDVVTGVKDFQPRFQSDGHPVEHCRQF